LRSQTDTLGNQAHFLPPPLQQLPFFCLSLLAASSVFSVSLMPFFGCAAAAGCGWFAAAPLFLSGLGAS